MQTLPVTYLIPSHEVPDTALVERARARDVTAFETLVGRYQSKLYRLTTRFVSNQTDRQEILQDALVAAWRNLPAFEGRAQFGNWMYRVTTNPALMHLRSRNRHPEIALGDIEPTALNDAFDMHGPMLGAGTDWSRRPDEVLQSRELRHHLQHAVDALPEGLRTVFLLRDVDGLSTEDTAEVLGLTVAAAKTRLHRARAALREAIRDYVVT